MALTPGLPDPYDGQPIVQVSPKVTNTGDGLSKSMTTDAVQLRLGDQLTVIMDVEVAGVDLRPVDKDDPAGPLVAKYVLRAGGRATIVDADDDTVAAILDAQQKRNDEAAGKPQLPLAEGDDPSRVSPGLTELPEGAAVLDDGTLDGKVLVQSAANGEAGTG